MATIVKVDLSDPTSPERTQELTFEGSVIGSRAVGDSIRMVVSSNSWELPFVTPDQVMANWPAVAPERRQCMDQGRVDRPVTEPCRRQL